MPQITIETSGGMHALVTRARGRTGLTEVLRRADLPLNTRCGERGLCDGCLIELVRGALIRKTDGQVLAANGEPITVRACECQVPPDGADLTICIPPRSLLAHQPQVVSDFRINVLWSHDPLVPGGARKSTGVNSEMTPVPFSLPVLGVAIDIGTTTVAVLLVDLATGEIVSRAASFNRQMHLGDDVLTRINLCCTDKAMVGQLKDAVIRQTIGPLVAEAFRHAAPDKQGAIACITIAGNTTMLHLAAGVDPSPMGIAPFPAVFLGHRETTGRAIGLVLPEASSPKSKVQSPKTGKAESDFKSEISNSKSEIADRKSQISDLKSEISICTSDPPVHLLPSAAAYVGADLVAGILASGLAYEDGPSLLVDVGTNGEIILKRGDTLLGCATAAGPAFEGSRLTSGIRAGYGAISDIRIKTHPFTIETKIIGSPATGGGESREEKGERRQETAASRPDDSTLSSLPPTLSQAIGLCGSAYIDFLAEARRAGLVNTSGRFDEGFLQAHVPPELLLPGDVAEGRKLRIAIGRGHRDLVVSEADIAQLLQAKAAIAAGILTLLHQAGITPDQVKTVHLAGGFGTHMSRAHAIACGLLPGFTARQVEVVGNSSLAGAYLSLLDSSVLPELERIARRLQVVELNLDPGFEDRYVDQLSLP